jgi:formate--tetrahydrofolate ligase
MLYPLEAGLASKFTAVATQVYGAEGADFAPEVEQQLAEYETLGYGRLPVCIAKTQYSLSHDPAQLGRPTGFRVPIHGIRVAAGAGFVYGLAGDIVTMPGLPSQPAAQQIDVTADGRITGLH